MKNIFNTGLGNNFKNINNKCDVNVVKILKKSND